MTTPIKWTKLGCIFNPVEANTLISSYASVPIAEHLSGDIFKIYFSYRDKKNRSSIAYIVVDLKTPFVILEQSVSPVLSPGQLGAFDDSGAMASWLLHVGRKRYMYYIGWNLGVTVPFRNSIGLSISEDGGDYVRYAIGPILDRTQTEPHFCASCCVIQDDGIWKMWYLSCTGWHLKEGKPEHSYHIKYAESDDGINWVRNGVISIDYADTDEYAISRPSVMKDAECWKMWYSTRGKSYRIGYAESDDGINWTRKDSEVGIDVSDAGWDSEMIEYPFIFDHLGKRYMLYNGNGYGATGFGIAVQE